MNALLQQRPLVLLLWLRLRGWVRKAARSLGSVKGIVLTLLGLLVFAPGLVASWFDRGRQSLAVPETIDRFGPWVLFAYCLLTLLFTRPEQSITFTPAEIQFLFPAPIRRKMLLIYKIVSLLGLLTLSAIFISIFTARNARWWVAAFLGLVQSLWFMQLFSMAVILMTMVVGVVARSWRRRLALALVVILLGWFLVRGGADAFGRWDAESLAEFESSPLIQLVLAPFQWLTRTFTAGNLPELLRWGGLSLLLNLGVIGLIVMLDARYLEASASASEKVHARLERTRRSGGIGLTVRHTGDRAPLLRFPLGSSWGGIAPLAWRQATTALRDFGRSLLLVLILAFVIAPILLASITNRPGRGPSSEAMPYIMQMTVLVTGMFLPALFPFDFRNDVDRIEFLKTLPIAPSRLVLGQILTPTALLSVSQWVLMVFIAWLRWPVSSTFLLIGISVFPINLLLILIENIVFLWFPYRMQSQTPGDMQTLGRAMIVLLAKLAVLGVVAAFAGALAAMLFFLTRSLDLAIVSAIAIVAIGVCALMPVASLGFRHYNVAADTPA